MERVLHESRAPQRASAFLMLVFAVVLAVVWVYGVLSYLVAHRTCEIGIRMALGAARQSVVWMILNEALAIMVLQPPAGLGAALVLSRSVSALLFEVAATDLLVFYCGATARRGGAGRQPGLWLAGRREFIHWSPSGTMRESAMTEFSGHARRLTPRLAGLPRGEPLGVQDAE